MSLICQNIRNQVNALAAWVGRSPTIANGLRTLNRQAEVISLRAKTYYVSCYNDSKKRLQTAAESVDYLLRFTTFVSIFQYGPFSLQTLGGAALLFAANHIQKEMAEMNADEVFQCPTRSYFSRRVDDLGKIVYRDPEEGKKYLCVMIAFQKAYAKWGKPIELVESSKYLKDILNVCWGNKDAAVLRKYLHQKNERAEVERIVRSLNVDPLAYDAMVQEIEAMAEENEVARNVALPQPVRNLYDMARVIAEGADKTEYTYVDGDGKVVPKPKPTLATANARGMIARFNLERDIRLPRRWW